MTPAAREDLRLVLGQLSGVQTHLEEMRIRLRALSHVLDDIAGGLVWTEGMAERPALILAVYVEDEATHLQRALDSLRIARVLAQGLRL